MKGFTLIELMIVLLIAGIVVVFGIPSMTQMVEDNRLTAEVNRFATSIRFARSEAIKRNATITVNRTGSTAAAWEDGWQIFLDDSGAGNAALNTGDGDTVIRIEQETDGAIEIRGNESTTGFLSYNGEGRPVRDSDDGIISFHICDSRGASEGVAITISLTGRISTGGIAEDEDCTP